MDPRKLLEDAVGDVAGRIGSIAYNEPARAFLDQQALFALYDTSKGKGYGKGPEQSEDMPVDILVQSYAQLAMDCADNYEARVKQAEIEIPLLSPAFMPGSRGSLSGSVSPMEISCVFRLSLLLYLYCDESSHSGSQPLAAEYYSCKSLQEMEYPFYLEHLCDLFRLDSVEREHVYTIVGGIDLRRQA